jgi:hypothetical protein
MDRWSATWIRALVPIFLVILGGCVDLTRPADPGSSVGGAGGMRPGDDVVSCDTPPASSRVLWNFEAGDINTFAFNQPGDKSAWDMFNDSTTGVQNRVVESTPRPPRCPDNRAMKLLTSGYSLWGSGVRGVLLPDRGFFDASSYSGLSLNVRTTGINLLVIKVFDSQTASAEFNGTCKRCAGWWTLNQSVGNDWANIRLPFSSFKFQGKNDLNLTAFDARTFIYLEFIVPNGNVGEVWLDDLTLYP